MNFLQQKWYVNLKKYIPGDLFGATDTVRESKSRLYSISSVAPFVASQIQRFTAERFNVVINSSEEVELRDRIRAPTYSRRRSDGESENNFFIGTRRLFRRGPPASDSSSAAT